MKNNNVFPLLLNVYLFIVGFSWIALQIYFRLIAKKSDYNLLEIKLFITTKAVIIFTAFIILHFCVIISILVYLYRIRRNKIPSSIVIQITDKISWVIDYIYWKPLEYIYELIAPDIPGSGRFFLWLDKYWTEKKYSYKYFYSLIFLFDVLPKLIVATTFFIEIVFYNRIYYFIYSLFFILIPIAFKIFLRLMLDFGVRNIPVLKTYFSHIDGINPRFNKFNEIIGYEKYAWTLKDEYDGVVNPQEEMRLILQLQSIQCFCLQIKDDINRMLPFVTLTTSMLFFIAGFYRLFLILI